MNGLVRSALGRAYRELIADRRAQAPFWILVGFLPTFIVARLTVSTNPNLYLDIHGVHVHHFTYGIFVLAIVGFVAVAWPQMRFYRWLAVVYGLGLALAFDEFGMWLRLTSNYNIDSSEDVMTGLLTFLVIAVYCTRIIRRALKYLPSGWHLEVGRELSDRARSLHREQTEQTQIAGGLFPAKERALFQEAVWGYYRHHAPARPTLAPGRSRRQLRPV